MRRRRITYLRNIRELTGLDAQAVLRMIGDKDEFVITITDLR